MACSFASTHITNLKEKKPYLFTWFKNFFGIARDLSVHTHTLAYSCMRSGLTDAQINLCLPLLIIHPLDSRNLENDAKYIVALISSKGL